ncbi:flagellar hook-associated protein FlgK [Psychrobacillus sp. Sa2BUA9]|uniref:Flagellar hook-associated protein 1 n=1 Tax=Psychrobacillus faecigallinarum TaxID=2762235 RepID=A0ABR8R5K5_9BACI|nr:flagellar hook-associated protein FlgK [Psychrobacillus faecigallinarum]MBD7943045.1 flagellar hook-associated protein FlgK [Psychrobacillus faecigallinarum]
MRSTFMGLEASKRGLFTQQSALYTTGHNISNANTIGFSRQRVNMEATLGYPGTGLNAPKTAGHIGTGVQAQSVQRIRDNFIDRQYRQETTKLGYWESRSNAISQIEDIVTEPSDYGLNTALDQFWNSLQDLSGSPENAATRKVVIQRALHVADSFNYTHKQLSDIQSNLGNEIKVSTDDINSILKQIASINEQIQAIEPNGYMPNDLYDARDSLIDDLSQYIPIETERVPSGGNALAIAEGSLTVTMKLKDGTKVELVNGKNFAQLETLDTSNNKLDGTDLTAGFKEIKITGLGGETITYNQLDPSKGKLVSLIDSFGHGDPATGYFTETLAKLDDMANAFMKEFNDIHKQGFTLAEGATASTNNQEFFTGVGASGIEVLEEIIKNPNLIAVSDAAGEVGNGKNAIKLANMKFNKLTDLDGATVQSFYQGVIGKLGVDGEQANRLTKNAGTILLTVANNRASVSSVSLDEEMTNMITFQQAYNANARMITVIDETLDKIINGMGRVGL